MASQEPCANVIPATPCEGGTCLKCGERLKECIMIVMMMEFDLMCHQFSGKV